MMRDGEKASIKTSECVMTSAKVRAGQHAIRGDDRFRVKRVQTKRSQFAE